MKICIVGLGYVGLPLAIQFARSNVNVIGLDVDKTKVRLINNGQTYTKHIQSSTIAKSIMPGDCSISIRETGDRKRIIGVLNSCRSTINYQGSLKPGS